MSDKLTYRCVKYNYPDLEPVFVLEQGNGEWHWLFGTDDRAYFGAYLKRAKIRLTETIERNEA